MKLIVTESETRALRAEIQKWSELASSIVSRVEVPRAVRRVMRARTPVETLNMVLDSIAFIDIDRGLAADASRLEPPTMRSLDAIHLATALSFGTDLGGFATYDSRLADAATHRGLTVLAPA